MHKLYSFDKNGNKQQPYNNVLKIYISDTDSEWGISFGFTVGRNLWFQKKHMLAKNKLTVGLSKVQEMVVVLVIRSSCSGFARQTSCPPLYQRNSNTCATQHKLVTWCSWSDSEIRLSILCCFCVSFTFYHDFHVLTAAIN